MTGALKVQTAPGVWTTIGGGSFATEAETVAGVLDDRAVTPAGLSAALDEVEGDLPFVTIAPSGGDDTALIQAAATALAPGGTLWFKPGIYQTSGTVTFGKVNVMMPIDVGFAPNTSGWINYTGSGAAVVFNASDNCEMRIAVRRATIDWDDGADTTSEGIVFRNCYGIRATVLAVYFWRGIVLRGDNSGVSYNNFDIVASDLNKTALYFDPIGTGWVNQNTFTGRLRLSSGASSYVGTCLIDMSVGGNGNTFLGVTLEGASHEKTFKVKANFNVFLNCRFEANVAGACEFLTGSYNNMVIGGFNHLSTEQNLFIDAGTTNMLLSAGGLSVYNSGGSYSGVSIEDETGLRNAVTLKSVDKIRGEVSAGGRVVCYDAAGKAVDPTPIVEIDGISTLRGIRFGFPGAPGTANVGRIYAYSAAFLGIQGSIAWGTTNTHDLGVSGALPRDIKAGRNIEATGAFRVAGTGSTSYIEFVSEQTPDPAAPGANGARLFTKDNGSGKTQLCVRYATGATQVISTEP